jgi:hypothetical protein
MPLCMCSAMWQWAIHRPGLVTSNKMSTVSPVRTSTVSFQTRLGSSSETAGLGRSILSGFFRPVSALAELYQFEDGT